MPKPSAPTTARFSARAEEAPAAPKLKGQNVSAAIEAIGDSSTRLAAARKVIEDHIADIERGHEAQGVALKRLAGEADDRIRELEAAHDREVRDLKDEHTKALHEKDLELRSLQTKNERLEEKLRKVQAQLA